MNTVAVVPNDPDPILYLTPEAPNLFSHARFTF